MKEQHHTRMKTTSVIYRQLSTCYTAFTTCYNMFILLFTNYKLLIRTCTSLYTMLTEIYLLHFECLIFSVRFYRPQIKQELSLTEKIKHSEFIQNKTINKYADTFFNIYLIHHRNIIKDERNSEKHKVFNYHLFLKILNLSSFLNKLYSGV